MASFRNVVVLAGSIFVFLASVNASQALSEEKRLIKFILENYERIGTVGRPVYNVSDIIRVNMGLALIQIMELDETNQVLVTNMWERYSWNDILLKWDPKDYGGVEHIKIPANKIWTPDIVLFNYADARVGDVRSTDTLAIVSSDGSVLWIPRSILKSTCSVDITYFPFDEQHCQLKFGSWTYDGFKLDVAFYDGLEQVDVNDYIQSNEWSLLSHPARKNIKYYPCCEEPYPDLTFTLHIKRISAFYNYLLILPCVLLSILILDIFWMPHDSPSRVILGVIIFIAFFQLLMLISSSTPPSASSIPLIGAYISFNMILVTVSIILTTIITNVSSKKGDVPSALRKVMKGLAKCLCVSIPSSDMKPDSESESSDAGEWRMVGMVMDRICFIIYLLIMVIFLLRLLV